MKRYQTPFGKPFDSVLLQVLPSSNSTIQGASTCQAGMEDQLGSVVCLASAANTWYLLSHTTRGNLPLNCCTGKFAREACYKLVTSKAVSVSNCHVGPQIPGTTSTAVGTMLVQTCNLVSCTAYAKQAMHEHGQHGCLHMMHNGFMFMR